MAIGELSEVDLAGVEDVYYVDVGMYDVPEYGAVYVVDAERPALVDTGLGTRYEVILDALAELDIAPEDLAVIAPTHVHLDHAGGAGYLAEACPNADVVCYEPGVRHLVDPSRLWEGTKRAVGSQIQYYAEPKPVPEERITTISDGDVVDLGDRVLETHAAPGHAPHQAVFFDPRADLLFAADAAGIYVPEHDAVHYVSPPPDFDLEQCVADAETLEALDPAVLCYAHFGPTLTADRLTEYVGVLETWVARVAAAREEHGDDEAVVRHFVERAEMAAAWGEEKAAAEAEMNVRGVLHYLDGVAAEAGAESA